MESSASPAPTAPTPVLPRWPYWWPILFAPVVVGLVYLSMATGWSQVFHRRVQDDMLLPYIITLAAFFVALGRGLVGRNPLMLLIAAMALAVFNREVHWFIQLGDDESFSPCSTMAYATLAAVCFIGWWRYDRIGPYLSRGRVAQWLIMTAITYVFAVGIAKGWFKVIVYNDDAMRSYLEETIENVAHTMLLLTTFTGRAPSRQAATAPDAALA